MNIFRKDLLTVLFTLTELSTSSPLSNAILRTIKVELVTFCGQFFAVSSSKLKFLISEKSILFSILAPQVFTLIDSGWVDEHWGELKNLSVGCRRVHVCSDKLQEHATSIYAKA